MRSGALVVTLIAMLGCASADDSLPQEEAGPDASGGFDAHRDDTALPTDGGPEADASVMDDSGAEVDGSVTSKAPHQVICGYEHTCALATDGTLRCWGSNSNGQLGAGIPGGIVAKPLDVPLVGVTQVSAGHGQTCAIASGSLYCWGLGLLGLLGDGVLPGPVSIAAPTPITSLADVLAVSSKGSSACVLMPDRTVRCWGFALVDQLGYQPTTRCGLADDPDALCSAVPTTVDGLGPLAEISHGDAHTCVRTQVDDEVYCWGDNSYGELGDGSTVRRWKPGRVSGLPPVARIFAGAAETCALSTTGQVFCWGAERLPKGLWRAHPVPELVTGFAGPVVDLQANGGQRCALLADGRLQCWGRGNAIPGGFRSAPTTVEGLPPVSTFCSSAISACAITTVGELYCWGSGPVGDGSLGEYPGTPVKVDW